MLFKSLHEGSIMPGPLLGLRTFFPGTIALLNTWVIHTFPPVYPVRMLHLRCRRCNITITHRPSSLREYGTCFWCNR